MNLKARKHSSSLNILDLTAVYVKLIKAVFDTVLDMIDTAYYDKRLIFIRAICLS